MNGSTIPEHNCMYMAEHLTPAGVQLVKFASYKSRHKLV